MGSVSPAVGHAMDVLLHLASRAGPVPGSTLARELGIPRSSLYHILDVLIDRGFVVRLPDQRGFGLGVAAFEIGSAYLRHEPLELLARPILKRLVRNVNETAHLGVLHGAETLYLIKEQPSRVRVPVTLVTEVGVRLPAHLTASGRSILAHLPAAQVRAVFPSAASFIDRTGNGPASLPQLRRILAAERNQGWAEEDGMVTAGLQSVAACAFDHSGRPLAAISVTRRRDRSAISIESLARAVRDAARQLTVAVSGVGPPGWFDYPSGPTTASAAATTAPDATSSTTAAISGARNRSGPGPATC